MLKKMGWREGAGIGKLEDGIKSPIQPFQQRAKRGLGSEPPKQQKQGRAGKGRKRKASSRAKATSSSTSSSSSSSEEEAGEVRSVRAKAARRDEEEKRLRAQIYRSFYDEPDGDGRDHPLARPNRLTSQNPLLSDSD